MDYQKEFNKVLVSRAHCNLGKKGITEDFKNHVIKLLKKYKIIKIKALKSIANKNNIHSIAHELSTLTNSYLIDIRGKQIILSNSPIKKKV